MKYKITVNPLTKSIVDPWIHTNFTFWIRATHSFPTRFEKSWLFKDDNIRWIFDIFVFHSEYKKVLTHVVFYSSSLEWCSSKIGFHKYIIHYSKYKNDVHNNNFQYDELHDNNTRDKRILESQKNIDHTCNSKITK